MRRRKGLMTAAAALVLTGVILTSGCSSGRIHSLCVAIEKGNNEEAVRLAEKSRDLNAPSSGFPRLISFVEGEVTTPLVKACETGNAEMIAWLLDHGARADYAPGDIPYPLEAFCESGTGAGKATLRKLLVCGASPEQFKYRAPLSRLAQTLRHRSAETKQDGIDMALMLLDSGASCQDPEDGFTILHYAAMEEDGTLMRILLERDDVLKCINDKNDSGQTPLDIAEENGNTECMQLLLSAGAAGEKTR